MTVEDLLRFKRAERPRAEFWTEFDRELRAKQLAALVEKRPWWRALPRMVGGLARYHLPLGATAVLAVTLFSLRDFQFVNGRPVTPASDAATAEVPSTDVLPVAPTSTTVAESTATAIEANVAEVAAAPVLTSAGNAPGELSRLVPMLANATDSRAEITPSERSIAANRAVAEAMFGTTTSGFEARALPVRMTPQEPLTQMTNPAETRRSRFAAAFAAAAASGSPVQTARVARRLSDEQLYDSIHRFGASGNTVSIRF